MFFALDPFCIRQNDRVLLETALMLWVMLGYLVFASMIGATAIESRLATRGRRWPVVRLRGADQGRGALLTLLPLLATAALRWAPAGP